MQKCLKHMAFKVCSSLTSHMQKNEVGYINAFTQNNGFCYYYNYLCNKLYFQREVAYISSLKASYCWTEDCKKFIGCHS